MLTDEPQHGETTMNKKSLNILKQQPINVQLHQSLWLCKINYFLIELIYLSGQETQEPLHVTFWTSQGETLTCTHTHSRPIRMGDPSRGGQTTKLTNGDRANWCIPATSKSTSKRVGILSLFCSFVVLTKGNQKPRPHNT